MSKKDYFPEESLIKDDFYKNLEPLLICPICKKIYKDPVMCSKCQSIYCKNCINDSKCVKECDDAIFNNSISKMELLSKIKYRCNNCYEEVKQMDINSHLQKNCKSCKICPKEEKLIDTYTKKKKLLI